METSAQAAQRLVSALEELAAQEQANLCQLDLGAVVQVIERAAPLVQRLAELAGDPAAALLRDRIESVLRQRRQSAGLLGAHLARVRAELHHVDAARSRLARLVPAYQSPSGRRRARLHAAA